MIIYYFPQKLLSPKINTVNDVNNTGEESKLVVKLIKSTRTAFRMSYIETPFRTIL